MWLYRFYAFIWEIWEKNMSDFQSYFGFEQNLHETKSLLELIAAAIFPISYQRIIYIERKWVYSLKFQLALPNGLIATLSGPYEGNTMIALGFMSQICWRIWNNLHGLLIIPYIPMGIQPNPWVSTITAISAISAISARPKQWGQDKTEVWVRSE